MTILTACPVCHTRTTATGSGAIVFEPHRDKIGRLCPMSGVPINMEKML